MKNILWSFGDSFTEDIKSRLEWMKPQFAPETYKLPEYFRNKYGEDNIQSFQYYLAKDFNFDNKTVATSGNSNYHIFNNICENVDNFQENDIVIVEWSMLNRFGLPTDLEDEEKLISCRLDNYSNFELSNESFSKIFEYREEKTYYKKEILLYSKILKELSKSKKFNLFFWCLDDKILRYVTEKKFIDEYWFFYPKIKEYQDYRDYFKENGVTTMTEECEKLYHDVHYGPLGLKRQYELMKGYINENISYR